MWIAWDHTARLIDAATQEARRDHARASPGWTQRPRLHARASPVWAFPKGRPDRASSEKLIEYLTQPQTQITTLTQLAFFPATGAPIPDRASSRRQARGGCGGQAVRRRRTPSPSLLPVGLGAQGNEFNKRLHRYVHAHRDQQRRRADGARTTRAASCRRSSTRLAPPCWAPDPPSDGPCKVK